MDWHDIKFLESPKNLKSVLSVSLGRTPSTNIVNDVATCLEQGRLFFQAAEVGPMEIKPLQVFYGVVNFAKALASARQLKLTSAFAQAHGVKDISNANAKLQDLSLRIESRGTFQEFNNVICKTDSINYYSHETQLVKIYKPTANASDLVGIELSLKDILSRCPFILDLYRKSFNNSSNLLNFSFFSLNASQIILTVHLKELFKNRESLIGLISRLRIDYPFLSKWMLKEAALGWDHSVLSFINCEFNFDEEFNEAILLGDGGNFRNMNDYQVINMDMLLPPLAGGVINEYPIYISPVGIQYISEYSLIYLGNFLLSSLVRYRPQIWVHALNGRVTQDRPADDSCVALIESFLAKSLSTFPQYVSQSMEVQVT